MSDPHAIVARRLRDARAILVEPGYRKMIGGQEGVIVDVVLDMLRARDSA